MPVGLHFHRCPVKEHPGNRKMRLTTARRNGSSKGTVSPLFVAAAFHEHGKCRLDYMCRGFEPRRGPRGRRSSVGRAITVHQTLVAMPFAKHGECRSDYMDFLGCGFESRRIARSVAQWIEQEAMSGQSFVAVFLTNYPRRLIRCGW